VIIVAKKSYYNKIMFNCNNKTKSIWEIINENKWISKKDI
jgi:hypothetical protein